MEGYMNRICTLPAGHSGACRPRPTDAAWRGQPERWRGWCCKVYRVLDPAPPSSSLEKAPDSLQEDK